MKLTLLLLQMFIVIHANVESNSNDVTNAYIGECYLTSAEEFEIRDDYGEKLTFVCVSDFIQTNFFDVSSASRCSKSTDFQKNQIEQINFENCSMSNIGYPIFEVYKNVNTLNATNLGLGSLQKELFREAKNLTELNVSHNRIVELPSLLFVYAAKLTEADFSFNQINYIKFDAFTGDSKMIKLNLAHNNIAALHKQFFDYLPHLKELNLSHNVITTLEAHTFDNLTNLEMLNLSHNRIEQLSINVFASLTKLRHLNLSHANLTEVKPKTFSRLHELQTLDLSHNKLKALDVHVLDSGIFLLRFDHLQRLYIGGNQLSVLNGFSSTRFPVIKFIGIPENNFDCCYLMKLFRSIGWQQLDVPFDANSNHPNISDSTGVKCDFTDDFQYNSEITQFAWVEVLSVISALFIVLLFVMVISILKQNRHFRMNSTCENITIQCDSISNLDNTNVYDVPKF